MKHNWNSSFIVKVVLLGLFVGLLLYLLHPAQGQFMMVINGEPVSDSVAQFAALPTLLAALFFTAVLSVLAFFGVGLFIFMVALLFMLLAIFMIAPYAWPLLLVVFIIILIVLFGRKNVGQNLP